jgi:acyl CoA:acetate/3-ketoacid CoA transferase beta subunit
LKAALEKVKAKFARELAECPDCLFTDTSILEDVIHHEIMIREGYDAPQIEDVVKSYLCNVRIAEQFHDITSEHMISEIA